MAPQPGVLCTAGWWEEGGVGHPLLIAAPKGYVLLQNEKQLYQGFMAVVFGGS